MLRLRPATSEDSADVLAWRNDAQTRANSHNSDPVGTSDHTAWYDSALENPDRVLLICISDAGDKLGIVRFDLAAPNAQISINLAPLARGKGYGARCLSLAAAYIFEHHSDIHRILAEIKTHNRASRKAFEAAGFQDTAQNGPVLTYALERAR